MLRGVTGLSCLVLSLAMVSVVSAQGLIGQGSLGMYHGGYSSGSETWSPFIKVGFQCVRLNFHMSHDEEEDLSPIGLKLRDTVVPAASVGFDARMWQGLTFTLVGAGSVLESFHAVTNPDIILRPASSLPWGTAHWKGSKFRWAAIDGSLSYGFYTQTFLVLGFRWSHFSMTLREPNLEGILIDPEQQQPVPEDVIYSYRSDFQIKEWMPYVGAQLQGASWKARVLGSPIIYSKVPVPFRFTEIDDAGQPDEERELKENRFRLFDRGWFIEGSLEYWIPPSLLQPLEVGLWFNASYLTVKDLGAKNTASETPNDVETERGRATYTRTMYGIGASASVAF